MVIAGGVGVTLWSFFYDTGFTTYIDWRAPDKISKTVLKPMSEEMFVSQSKTVLSFQFNANSPISIATQVNKILLP